MVVKDNEFLVEAAALCAGQNVDDVCILAISLLMSGVHQRTGSKQEALAMLDVTHRIMRRCMDDEYDHVAATGELYECRKH